MSEPSTYLVTGVNGCIGAWVARQLIDEGAVVVGLDSARDTHRLDLVFDQAPHGRTNLNVHTGDVSDLSLLTRLVREHKVDAIIHLAALQVPAVASHPLDGARVNVMGTTAVFEAARQTETSAPVVFASSVAAHDAVELGKSERSVSAGQPSTLYGVFKRANEGTAAVYWADHGVASIGIRPSVVYGPGRDSGLTSAPTQAMVAATRGEPFHIAYGGITQMQFARDVANAFISAARAPFQGAITGDLGGPPYTMGEIVAAIERAEPSCAGLITWSEVQLPFPADLSSAGLPFDVQFACSLDEGIGETLEHFRRVQRAGDTGGVTQ